MPGEIIRIVTGAFAAATGRVVEVDEKMQTLKVRVSVFNKLRAVDFKFREAEKIRFAEEE